MSFVFRYLLAVILTAALFGLASPDARAADQGAILVYPVSYFDGIELNTAREMVTRVPGFVFIDTDSSKRGFGAASGNVLVDSVRPSSKTDTLSSVLDRIPRARVERIEVIRGSAPGIDMQGQTVVANVILRRADESHLIATLTNTIYGDGHLGPGASLEFTSRVGENSYDVMLSRINTVDDDSAGNGTRTLTLPGQPTIIDASHHRGAEKAGYGLNASLSRPVLQGAFTANLTLQQTTFNSAVFYDAPAAASFPSSHKIRSAEIGANWDRSFGPVEVTLVGLQRLERNAYFNASISSGVNQTFTSVSDTSESILRSTVRYIPSQTLTLEGGLEGAYNLLDGHSSFISSGARVALPAGDPKVNEKRGEANIQASWRFAPDWSLEAGTRFEFSTISAQGVPAREFSFIKPRLLLSWAPITNMQLRVRVERVVGQLNFDNFIASSNFSSNGISAGNLGLKPDQRWQFEGDFEYHFWDKGALVLSYTRENITDLVDFIPIGGGLDGPGNIPKAINNIYNLELSMPLDRLGWEGGTFKPSLVWKDAAVPDPVTGQIRQISGVQDRKLVFNFLQDIPAWHSSIELTTQTAFKRPNFRIAQVNYLQLRPLYVELDWDYKPKPDLDLQIKLQNIVPYQYDLTQFNYAGPRDISPLTSIQLEHNHGQARIFLQLRKTF
jgi:outer membrane receptor protein involved in Fe transport